MTTCPCPSLLERRIRAGCMVQAAPSHTARCAKSARCCRASSHFEIYIRAMEGAGARTQPILSFVADVARGDLTEAAFQRTSVPSTVRRFVQTTLSFCRASLPERVAAFTVGREEIIPAMFTAALRDYPIGNSSMDSSGTSSAIVTIDRDHHGPLAARLFETVCLSDAATRGRAFTGRAAGA